MAVHHAVIISRQRNRGYRPSRVNVIAQGLSTPDPSLSPLHTSIRRGRATTTHYRHHQVSLMVSRNTTLVPSLGLRIGPACEAGLSAGTQIDRVSPQIRKKGRSMLRLGLEERQPWYSCAVPSATRASFSQCETANKKAITQVIQFTFLFLLHLV